MNDDQDTNTLFNPVLKIHLEAPHSRWLVSVGCGDSAAKQIFSLNAGFGPVKRFIKGAALHLAHVNWQKIEEMKTKDSVTTSGLTAEERKSKHAVTIATRVKMKRILFWKTRTLFHSPKSIWI
ncbi:hypothetical protein GQ600_26944 [Phytophthora cactorum]|nr:hypothetical protein GQ600_26944 [Phytophthora cactorum]